MNLQDEFKSNADKLNKLSYDLEYNEITKKDMITRLKHIVFELEVITEDLIKQTKDELIQKEAA